MKQLSQLLLLSLLLSSTFLSAQCVADTTIPYIPGIYPDPITPFDGCQFNEIDITFIFPRDTVVRVAGQNVTVPFQSFQITGVTGLPQGINWQCNLDSINCLYDVNPSNLSPDSVGCMRFFGTPNIPGTYPISVNLDVDLGFFGQIQTAYAGLLVVNPCTFNGACYDYTLSSNCQPATLDLTNNLPSNGQAGITYSWAVSGPGLSFNTTDENPIQLNISQAGTYNIQYAASFDTLGFRLDSIEIQAVNCSDPIVNTRPELYWKLLDPNGASLLNTIANPILNARTPLMISPLNFQLINGTYEFRVLDEDSGLGGSDDGCAGGDSVVTFTVANLVAGPNSVSNNGLVVVFYVSKLISVITCSDTFTIDSLPITPTFTATTSLACEGDSILLNMTSVTSDSMQWYKDGFPIAGANSGMLLVFESGNYTLNLINRMTLCQSSSMALQLTFISVAVPSLTVNGANLSISNPDANLTYQWYRDGTALTTGTSLIATLSGQYWAVAIESTAACTSDTSGHVGFIATAISPLESLLADLQLFPNPNQGSFTIKMDLLRAAQVAFGLYDLNGKLLLKENLGQQQGSFQYQVEAKTLPTGMYILKLKLEESVVSRRLMIVK